MPKRLYRPSHFQTIGKQCRSNKSWIVSKGRRGTRLFDDFNQGLLQVREAWRLVHKHSPSIFTARWSLGNRDRYVSKRSIWARRVVQMTTEIRNCAISIPYNTKLARIPRISGPVLGDENESDELQRWHSADCWRWMHWHFGHWDAIDGLSWHC